MLLFRVSNYLNVVQNICQPLFCTKGGVYINTYMPKFGSFELLLNCIIISIANQNNVRYSVTLSYSY